ncbi:zinc ABC transporter ATP-binding protein AztA [Rhodoligotrophos defluvii]|uniref:zinc ABC transporter ATP-binding protein AztA n=1 Tax=Rhodoligotrophos defluvii TaxID=2561934 RepID=UPI0010C9A080|nr:zinc ABC transporter ATP-binding protein AztA [Rhodoligotrophos defluvii]
MAGPALKLVDVTLAYGRQPAVRGVTGTFAPGSLTAVVGPNGAGKSTLLKGIIGSLRPIKGRIEIEGVKRREIAYLPQSADIDRSFPITVLDLVALGTWSVAGMFRRIAGREMERVMQAIQAVGLDGLQHRTIGTLSGGQLQRALFARMLLQDAKLLLLDEPFTAIDSKTTADLLDLIHRWHGEQRTVIAVLHDLDLVREHFPEALLLARDPVDWADTPKVLTPENLLSARRMCEAWEEEVSASLRKVA